MATPGEWSWIWKNLISNGRWQCFLFESIDLKRRLVENSSLITKMPAGLIKRRSVVDQVFRVGHFVQENVQGRKKVDSKTRYSQFKIKELDKSEEPKALVSVDSMLNWSDHESEDMEKVDATDAKTEFALMGLSPQVQSCPFDCNHNYTKLKKEFDNLEVQYKDCFLQVQAYKSSLQNLEQQSLWYQNNQLALEEKIRILTADLGNTTNMLKYTEKLNEQANLDNMNTKVKLEESNARFDKWKESSKNLVKLINSSMSSRSRFGLGYGEPFGSQMRCLISSAPIS
ncbi:hypothetical protein Tco_0534555 [Tanacetum coccineum]